MAENLLKILEKMPDQFCGLCFGGPKNKERIACRHSRFLVQIFPLTPVLSLGELPSIDSISIKTAEYRFHRYAIDPRDGLGPLYFQYAVFEGVTPEEGWERLLRTYFDEPDRKMCRIILRHCKTRRSNSVPKRRFA
jgi:hypothetical protein